MRKTSFVAGEIGKVSTDVSPKFLEAARKQMGDKALTGLKDERIQGIGDTIVEYRGKLLLDLIKKGWETAGGAAGGGTSIYNILKYRVNGELVQHIKYHDGETDGWFVLETYYKKGNKFNTETIESTPGMHVIRRVTHGE